MANIPIFTITHTYTFPKQMGGGKGHSDLGMFLCFGNGTVVPIFTNEKDKTRTLGLVREQLKGRQYRYKRVKNAHNVMSEIESTLQAEMEKGLELSDWITHMSNQELTIADVEKLKPGDKLEVIMLHRNLGDIVRDPRAFPYGEYFEPEEFFAGVRGTYTHGKDMSGHIRHHEDDYVDSSFNFHLNYRGNHWYPLGDDGLLPVETGETCVRGAIADYRKYPKTTKVGWRGPMLLVSSLKDAPLVYHEKQECCIM